MKPLTVHTLLLFCTILILFTSGVQPLSALAEPEEKTLDDLWIEVGIGPPIVPIFNNVARGDDIARVMHPSQIAQLDGISNGLKLVIFKSISEPNNICPI